MEENPWLAEEIYQLELELRRNSRAKSKNKQELEMSKLALVLIPLFLFVTLAVTVTSCNYTISMVHTEGQATDVIDNDQTAEPDISPTLTIPATAVGL